MSTPLNTSPTGAEIARAQRLLEAHKAQQATALQQVAAPSQKAAFAEAVEELIHTVVAPSTVELDIDALIATARERLSLAPTPADSTADDEYEAPDAAVISSMTAEAAALKRAEDKAKKDREKISSFLTELLPAGRTALTVHGATVFTAKRSADSRVLNTDFIKSKHPDIAGNEDYWTTRDGNVTRTYK